jgi:hypothetical protein
MNLRATCRTSLLPALRRCTRPPCEQPSSDARRQVIADPTVPVMVKIDCRDEGLHKTKWVYGGLHWEVRVAGNSFATVEI